MWVFAAEMPQRGEMLQARIQDSIWNPGPGEKTRVSRSADTGILLSTLRFMIYNLQLKQQAIKSKRGNILLRAYSVREQRDAVVHEDTPWPAKSVAAWWRRAPFDVGA